MSRDTPHVLNLPAQKNNELKLQDKNVRKNNPMDRDSKS
jgi:hypothetical protein